MTLSETERKQQAVDAFFQEIDGLPDDQQRALLAARRQLQLHPPSSAERQAILDVLFEAAEAHRAYKVASRPKVKSTILRDEVSTPGGYLISENGEEPVFVPVDMSPEGRAQRMAARAEAQKSQVSDGKGGVVKSEAVAAILETVEARRPVDIHDVFALDAAEQRALWKQLPGNVKRAITAQASKLAPMRSPGRR